MQQVELKLTNHTQKVTLNAKTMPESTRSQSVHISGDNLTYFGLVWFLNNWTHPWCVWVQENLSQLLLCINCYWGRSEILLNVRKSIQYNVFCSFSI